MLWIWSFSVETIELKFITIFSLRHNCLCISERLYGFRFTWRGFDFHFCILMAFIGVVGESNLQGDFCAIGKLH